MKEVDMINGKIGDILNDEELTILEFINPKINKNETIEYAIDKLMQYLEKNQDKEYQEILEKLCKYYPIY